MLWCPHHIMIYTFSSGVNRYTTPSLLLVLEQGPKAKTEDSQSWWLSKVKFLKDMKIAQPKWQKWI